MQKERRIILSMIALGRITPREAERLLAVWSLGREEFWVIAACMVASLTQIVPSLRAWFTRCFRKGFRGCITP